MNMNDDVFMSDPFLSLDVDLDDVSEVIRSNAFGDQKMLCEGSRTPSPQYLRDSDVFVSPMQHIGPAHLNVDAEREIGHIVSLLQENSVDGYASHAIHDQFQPAYASHDYVQQGNVYNNGPQPNEFHHMLQPQLVDMQTSPAPFSVAMPPSVPEFVDSDASHSYAVYTTDAFTQQSTLGVPTTSTIDMHDQMNVQEYHTQVHETRVRSIKQEIHSPESPPTPMKTKTELIRMLLEMSPTELENMRRGKNRTAQPPVDPPAEGTSQHLYRTMTPAIEHNPIDPMDTSSQRVFVPSGLLSPTTSTAPSASNDWRDDSDGDSDQRTPAPPQRKGPKTERRTAHNLIEKKYRCSINDRINHLKEMLASDENKLSKSATLRKAIEHINMLRSQNAELLKENERLRTVLSKAGVEIAAVGLRTTGNGAVYQSSAATSRESSLSPQSQSHEAPPPPRAKKSRPMLDQSRVTLCVFVFAMIFFNPVSLLFSPESPAMAAEAGSPELRMKVPHRTLQSIAGDDPFDSSGGTSWFDQSATQNFLIWTLNAIIVGIVLTRLLIFGEPVTDRRSPTWTAFMAAKQNSNYAISVGNYKEARRQLCDALQVIDRALPSRGGFDELMSVVWQIIRHFLNGLWIGRWLARRRRSEALPVPAVCKSHASAALVYHQLHQLHLIGITGSQCGHLYALNLSLSAANLSESAGISKTGITHKKRAEIYLNAALRMKLSLPRFLAPVFTAYFIRRARRHVRKSMSNDGVEWRSAQWFFHPLAHNFLGNKEVLTEILENPRQMTNFPFSDSTFSPKPVERLTQAFKIHLLALLVKQLSLAPENLRLSDFVDISQLLLTICMADISTTKAPAKDACMNDWDADLAEQGDELCTWWAHMTTCALYWRYGDMTRAHKHYALVRKCPQKLLNNDLALSAGLAFCTRKMCYEDRTKKNFTDMTWVHVQKSFSHAKKEDVFNGRKNSTMSYVVQKAIRAITCEWLLLSLVDLWHNTLDDQPCWQQIAPRQMRRLYHEIHSHYKSVDSEWSSEKLAMFKLLGRVLHGSNPLHTWQLLKNISPPGVKCADASSSSKVSDDSTCDLESIGAVQRLQKDLRLVCNLKSI